MVSSSKILTVSYGTFSCTLEGFDDSFDTMKAIAEYFRDLAQDDRYFGAEPPTPDAEMLARIAEREIARRVEARMENGSYVLRPSLTAPAAQPTAAPVPPAAPAQAAPTQPAPTQATRAPATQTPVTGSPVPAAPQPAPIRSAQPDTQQPLAEDDAAATAAAETPDAMDVALAAQRAMTAAQPEDQPEDQTEPDAEVVYADDADKQDDDTAVIDPAESAPVAATAADANSVAAKLQRIRAVVSASGAPMAAYSEDQHADAVLAQDATDDLDTSASQPAAATDQDGDDDNLFTDTIAGFVAAQDTIDAQDTDTASDEDEDDLEDAVAAGDFDDFDDEDAYEDVAEAAQTPTEPSPALRARVVKVKRADLNAAIASGLIEEYDDEAAQPAAPETSLSPEEEADLARELAAVEAELADTWDAAGEDEDDTASDAVAAADEGDFDDDAEDTYEEEIAPRRDTGLRLRKDPAPAAVPALDETDDTDETDEAAILATASRKSSAWDEDLEEDLSTAFDDEDDEEEDEDNRALLARDDIDDAIGRMAVEGARKAVKMSSPARVMLTENAIEDEGNSVSRILDETNTQLKEPEGNRRRSAIAHLRAAVAATRADRVLGRRKDTDKESEPYRADLANAVRPRRPVSSSDTRSERPADVKPAPLKLVAEQRVDAVETTASSAAPIRPRRVIREDEADMADLRDTDDADLGFVEFAESMGATGLAELLEAAAAYMSFVEGRDQFSRPQLMTKVRQAEEQESSREDRLRSFGQLLREGKIEKTHGGRFTASDRISFKPGARAAG